MCAAPVQGHSNTEIGKEVAEKMNSGSRQAISLKSLPGHFECNGDVTPTDLLLKLYPCVINTGGTSMRVLTQADIGFFLEEKPAAAIHFDAKWDATHRAVTRSAMADAEQVLAERANFGEVDCDSDPELAKSIPIIKVPSVAYYRDGKLVGALIGVESRRATPLRAGPPWRPIR